VELDASIDRGRVTFIGGGNPLGPAPREGGSTRGGAPPVNPNGPATPL
jgi:hypothetical protein